MKQVLIRSGEAVIEDVPAPLVEAGGVLVGVEFSCISIGTEMSGLRTSGLPLWKRAIEQPDNVRKVLQLAGSQGLGKARSLVTGKLAGGNPTGYSAAGVVIDVGDRVSDIRPGDRVACAGAQCAFHAEVIHVPRNLCALVPANVDVRTASTVTLGAIALQGVRRAKPTLGETFVVIGLGSIGQLTVQILEAHGARTIGIDPDRARVEQALSLGMSAAVHPQADADIDQVMRLTEGIGADGVIITAATPSSAVMATAFRMCRKKGRVVLVGDVGLNLNRSDFYIKELDFFISSSYGPGRYDQRYEEQGLDYPVGYVRWTENRNMQAYLQLLAQRRVCVDPLITTSFPIERAAVAYAALDAGDQKPLMVLLSYSRVTEREPPARVVHNPAIVRVRHGAIRIAVVGAGSFAKSMHLPNLQSMPDRFAIRAIVSRTGHNAHATAKQFGAPYATTDFHAVLSDRDLDAVLIATRPFLHASMALAALRAGKHVLVEKPLALTAAELAALTAFYAEGEASKLPLLLTGFNRRFSPLFDPIRLATRGRTNPLMISYRMNAGHVPLGHWLHEGENGSRNLSEACHVYDLVTCLTDSRVVTVAAQAIRPATAHYTHADNFSVLLRFEDGSVATVMYTALGSRKHPKEQMEVFADGGVLVLDDYVRLTARGLRVPSMKKRVADKGQRNELLAFADAIQQTRAWPIPLWQQIQATEIAFEVERQLAHGDAPAEQAPSRS